MYPKTFTTSRGTVTVLAFRQSRYAGRRCYEIELSGDTDAYFDPTCEILARDPLPDGSTRVWYIPGGDTDEDQFDRDYAAKLDALGAWATDR